MSTLSIEFISTGDYSAVNVEEFLPTIESHAPRVSTLELDCVRELEDLLDVVYLDKPDRAEVVQRRIQSFCGAFTGLRSLTLSSREVQYLVSLPRTLEVLKVRGADWQEFWESDGEATRLKGLLGAAPNLKRVRFESLYELDRGATLHQSRMENLNLCENRGIKLEWIGL